MTMTPGQRAPKIRTTLTKRTVDALEPATGGTRISEVDRKDITALHHDMREDRRPAGPRCRSLRGADATPHPLVLVQRSWNHSVEFRRVGVTHRASKRVRE